MLAAVTTAAGLYWFIAAEAWAMHLHGALFLAFVVAAAVFIWRWRDPATAPDAPPHADQVLMAGAIAAVICGLVGFLAGLVIALQLAYPALNFDVPLTNFGRLRPVHSSAVISAFGGNVLIMTSPHAVQNTCGARLALPLSAWFVIWGFQLFIDLAASVYVLGITQGKEYAEPQRYVDLWLTVVWVIYLVAFIATLWRRHEPHTHVANWFYLAFIVTIAILHFVNNAAQPVSFDGAKSYVVWAGVQDALTRRWYGHDAVGFFLAAGFLRIIYYYGSKRADRPVHSYRLSVIHLWALIFLYIWAGPHRLHYAALRDWA